MRSTKRLLLVAVPAALLAAAVLFAFFSAQRTLSRVSHNALTANQLGFSLQSLDLAATAAQNPGFEPVASPHTFTCGAFFQGDLYLAGPAGVSIYAPDGALRRILRTGLELPVAPIVGIALGHLRGAPDPELLLATAGAGLLLLDRDAKGAVSLRQLLPATADSRDLTALLPLASGDLLLGTRHGGVLLSDGASLSPVRFTFAGTDSAHLEVTSLASLDAASYLIGTRNAGLFFLHGGAVEHADTASGLPDNQVDAIVAAAAKIFAGTPLGVAQFDLTRSESGTTLRPSRVLAPGLFSHALAVDAAASELTVGALDQGIQRVRLGPNPQGRPHLRNASVAIPAAPESTQRVDQFLTQPNPAAPLYALADGALEVRPLQSYGSG